jgi:hypothetical protein
MPTTTHPTDTTTTGGSSDDYLQGGREHPWIGGAQVWYAATHDPGRGAEAPADFPAPGLERPGAWLYRYACADRSALSRTEAIALERESHIYQTPHTRHRNLPIELVYSEGEDRPSRVAEITPIFSLN